MNHFSLSVQHTSQWWVDRHVTSVRVIVSLAIANVIDRIIAIIILLFRHLHFFVLIFDKIKTGARPTLFY